MTIKETHPCDRRAPTTLCDPCFNAWSNKAMALAKEKGDANTVLDVALKVLVADQNRQSVVPCP